jgi:hypothetical protein
MSAGTIGQGGPAGATGGATGHGPIVTFEEAVDRTLYWTVSFYMAPDELPEAVSAAIQHGLSVSPGEQGSIRQIQFSHRASRDLSQAIDPLFNDISDRERLGQVDDYLFAADEDLDFTDLVIASPQELLWETEGTRFSCRPPGSAGEHAARVRRFWYVHKNGAVSWHLTFRTQYEHTPADFYFISMLQKVLAPKEFRPPGGIQVDEAMRVHRPPQGGTGVFPLDVIRIAEAGKAPVQFWVKVAEWFGGDAPHLFDRLAGGQGWRKRSAGVLDDPFGRLIALERFLEVPGLMMPRFRFMFFFQDGEFFRRLLPPIDPDTGKPTPRAMMVQERCYAPFLQKISEFESDDRSVDLGPAYWDWVLTRPDYVKLKAEKPETYAKLKGEIPAWEDDTRPDCLTYLFLSGFNQNIIDFMNQDASEIQDATDPVYPKTEDQITERFFVRFANARALTTYVRASRSLEAGNDYIGTCPYAFLIHVLALHNEFLARDYERATHALFSEVETLNAQGKLSEAAEAFYAFRIGPFADYFNHRYANVFRYDTEADVFSEVEQRRGTERKTIYLEGIVSNLEKQTGDLQARIQKKEDKTFTFAVSAIGLFGLFQMLLQIEEMTENGISGHWERAAITFSLVGSAIVVIVFLAIARTSLFEGINKRPARRRRRRGR